MAGVGCKPQREARLLLLALSIRNLAAALKRRIVTGEDAAPYLEDYAAELFEEVKIRQREGA